MITLINEGTPPMHRYRTFAMTMLSCCMLSSTALAADYSLPEAGDILVRARVLNVMPQEDATITGGVTGDQVTIDNSAIPELDFSYFVTDNIAFELIAAVTPHDVSTSDSSAGALDIGKVWLLPPTLLAQYHYRELGAFKPYVGAGINYTVFYNDKAGGSVTDASYDNSFGPALQVGADYALDEHWMLNVDAKKIWINSDVRFNGGAIRADVDIDPWVVGVGLGYHF
jgi:outer membrane protein